MTLRDYLWRVKMPVMEQAHPPKASHDAESIEEALILLDRKIEAALKDIKQMEIDRATLRNAKDAIGRILGRDKQTDSLPRAIGATVERVMVPQRTPDPDEQTIIAALRGLGRFYASRDVAAKSGMDPKRVSRVTPRMRNRGYLVQHPKADPNSKLHFPLGLPDFVNPDGTVKPEHEYEQVDKLNRP